MISLGLWGDKMWRVFVGYRCHSCQFQVWIRVGTRMEDAPICVWWPQPHPTTAAHVPQVSSCWKMTRHVQMVSNKFIYKAIYNICSITILDVQGNQQVFKDFNEFSTRLISIQVPHWNPNILSFPPNIPVYHRACLPRQVYCTTDNWSEA